MVHDTNIKLIKREMIIVEREYALMERHPNITFDQNRLSLGQKHRPDKRLKHFPISLNSLNLLNIFDTLFCRN